MVAPGYKYNMTDIAAAMGIHQLRKAKDFHRTRAGIAEQYRQAFADLPLQLPALAPAQDSHAWHLFVIRLNEDAPLQRDDFIAEMAQRGIGCSVHFIPLHLQPYWRDSYRLSPEDFPCADAAFRAAVSLPIYTRMSQREIDRVISATREILGKK